MKTIGQILRTEREKKKLTLDDIHKFIKIHPKYLDALETGDYLVFSDKTHAKGFLKIYADFLGLNVSEALAFWRREFEAEFDKNISKTPANSFKALQESKLIITPGLVFSIVLLIFLVSFFGYLFFQYHSYSGSPRLEVYSPENSIVVTSDILDVTGKTDRDSTVLINNQKIILDTDGSFATSIKLSEGLNTLSFLATNKLGKKTEITRTIIYRPLDQAVDIEALPVVESTQSTRSNE